MEGQIKNYNNRRDQFQTKRVGHSGTLCSFYPRRILADSNFDKRRHYLDGFLLYFQYLILFRFLRTNGPKFFNIFSKAELKSTCPCFSIEVLRLFFESLTESFFNIICILFLLICLKDLRMNYFSEITPIKIG